MKKDVKVVVQRNRERAEAGDKWAQTKLGMRYLEGDGVERNDVEAKRWLRLAAEQGSQPAAKALEGIGLRAPSAPARQPRGSGRGRWCRGRQSWRQRGGGNQGGGDRGRG